VPEPDVDAFPLVKFAVPGGGTTIPVVFRVRWVSVWWTTPGAPSGTRLRVRVQPNFFPPSPMISWPWAPAPMHGAAVSVLDYPALLEWVPRLNLPPAPIVYELELDGVGSGRVELVVLIGELAFR
jgi:hypothetical protein